MKLKMIILMALLGVLITLTFIPAPTAQAADPQMWFGVFWEHDGLLSCIGPVIVYWQCVIIAIN